MGVTSIRNFVDLTGQRFGRLTVLERAGTQGRSTTWLCACDCGKRTVVLAQSLKNGTTRSCGCLKEDQRIDLTGQRYGRLTVLSRADGEKDEKSKWLCRCDCGREVVVRGKDLRSGDTKSCGCLRDEASRERARARAVHGMSNTRLYHLWNAIVQRCSGGGAKRSDVDGELLCEEWRNDFLTFRIWALANGYDDNMEIQRIDKGAGFDPENCRWVPCTRKGDGITTRTLVTYGGKTQEVRQWAKELDINSRTLMARLRKGWSVVDAFNAPVHSWTRGGDGQGAE